MSLDKPGDKEYAALVEALSKHFKPTPSEIVERFKFHSRVRKAGESVTTFVSKLRCLSEFCNFGETPKDMIRDRLVCGINNNATQKRLLAESKLSYEKAVELSLSMETAAQSMRELKVKFEGNVSHRPLQQEVHRVANSSSSSGQGGTKSVPTCYRCGNRGHCVTKCSLSKDIVCHNCGKPGHLRKAYLKQVRPGPASVVHGQFVESKRKKMSLKWKTPI